MSQPLLRLSQAVFRRSLLKPGQRPYSSRPDTTTPATTGSSSSTPAKAASQDGKLKQLAKKYGPAGVIVYLGIGAVDLGVTFGAIQLLGADKVQRLEQGLVDKLDQVKEKLGWEVKPKETENEQQTVDLSSKSSLLSVFLLSYGIHKTLLLPVRLAITTAITPAFVRKVHAWGWSRYAPRLFPLPPTPK
ncbi:hypothetical protein BC940DRAFT_311182 [Gongronella butleri]|nr:hypothetical protein BC940DRAFT_311182 [Gongronella butleri]